MLPPSVERETRHLFGRLEGNELAAAAIAEWAIFCLEEGLDTPSLCIAAGLDATENEFVARDYLARACRELGIHDLRGPQALESAVAAIMLDLLEGRLDARIATKRIYRMSFLPGSPDDLHAWVGLDDYFDSPGLFNCSHDELHDEAVEASSTWLGNHRLAPLQLMEASQ